MTCGKSTYYLIKPDREGMMGNNMSASETDSNN